MNIKKMKALAIMLITLFLSACASSGLNIINLFADASEFKLTKNIAYGDNIENNLDLYLPSDQKPNATVVFFYGGCWGKCSNLHKKHYMFVAQALTRKGIAVVIADYRAYPDVQFDEIMADAKNATQWTINNIQKHGATNNNIFLMGHSSGAHMAAMLALDSKYLAPSSLSKINGVISMAGPYDFYPFTGQYMYQLFSAKDDYAHSQPVNFVDSNSPSFLLLQGDKDKKVQARNAIKFSEKLTEHNVEHQLMLLDQKRHAAVLMNLAKPFREDKKVLSAIYDFIDKYQK